jgi:hypothetical protein
MRMHTRRMLLWFSASFVMPLGVSVQTTQGQQAPVVRVFSDKSHFEFC